MTRTSRQRIKEKKAKLRKARKGAPLPRCTCLIGLLPCPEHGWNMAPATPRKPSGGIVITNNDLDSFEVEFDVEFPDA